MTSRFERVAPDHLPVGYRSAIDDLLHRRAISIPRSPQIQFPVSVNELPLTSESVLLLAWSAAGRLSAMLIGNWNPENDPALASFEGKRPFWTSLACFGPALSAAETPSPLELIEETFPLADRITVHAPVADAMTATALGRLGFTLDSYMDFSFNVQASSGFDRAGPYLIRAGVPSDAPAIAGLHELHVRDQLGTSAFIAQPDPGRLADLRVDIAERIANASIFRVAVIEGRVIGVIEASCYEIPSDGPVRRAPSGRAGVIEWVAVHENHRRSGTGSALVAAAISELRSEAADYIYVCHGANNPFSTLGFWGRFGFQPVWGTWEMSVGESSSDGLA